MVVFREVHQETTMAAYERATLIGDSTRRAILTVGAGIAGAALVGPGQAAAGAAALDADATASLHQLLDDSDKARQLAARARGVLIFPKIVKAGFMVGAQGGDGVLRIKGVTTGYFRIVAGSFGFQAGMQTFSYAMFFITRSSLEYLRKSKGWAIGTGPSVVIADAGFAKTLNTTTLSQDVYAMPFGQKGLMAGIGLEGSKISRIFPGP
jgi:lipid-binding SYLF domain-containing protein